MEEIEERLKAQEDRTDIKKYIMNLNAFYDDIDKYDTAESAIFVVNSAVHTSIENSCHDNEFARNKIENNTFISDLIDAAVYAVYASLIAENFDWSQILDLNKIQDEIKKLLE